MSTESFAEDVRHPIDTFNLGSYLQQTRPDIFTAPFTLKQFGFGQSNPSYLLVDQHNRKYVLRKQPPGQLLSKSSHRIDREFHMIAGLKSTKVPVPEVYVLCEDSKIIGTPFYIMEFLQGRIFHSPIFEGVTSKDRTALWKETIKTLALLHTLDPSSLGLPASLFQVSSGSHFPRQMRTLSKISEAQAKSGVDPIPHFRSTVEWLSANFPEGPSCIVHGDYKVDNLVFHPTENRIIGLLDFELCTIGHPLADVGNLLQPFDVPKSVKLAGALEVRSGENGAFTLDQALAYYASQGVYDPRPDWKFGIAFTHLRLAVILQGVAAREKRGQASSTKAKEYGKLYPIFGRLSYEAVKDGALSNL